MKIIVGLGNPEPKYDNTYHNLGFIAVDKTADFFGVKIDKKKHKGLIGETLINGEKVVFVKPLTYMNLSGECVREVLSFYKATTFDLLIFSDDFDLPIGSIRIRKSGSSGTHNGLKNVIYNLGSEDFNRIRIGFKPETESKIPLIELVLSKIQDRETFDKVIDKAVKACAEFINGEDITNIISKYNGKAI